MSEQVFLFPSDISDSSEESDNEESGAGHVRRQRKDLKLNIPSPKENDNKTEENKPGKGKPSKRAKKEDMSVAAAQTLGDLKEAREALFKRRTIVYQLMATCVVVMLHGISFLPYFWSNSLMNIRSIREQTATQWSVLLAYIVSCFYTPSFLYRVQMRWTMACGCLIATLFSVARFYPTLITLVPCGILLGLSLGPFYSAAGRHVARLASLYEGYRGSMYEDTVKAFTPVFFACAQFSPVWVSLLHVVLFDLSHFVLDPHRLLPPSGSCGFFYIWDFKSGYGPTNGMAPEIHDALTAQLGSCLICTIGGVLLSITALQEVEFPRTGNELISKERVTEEVKQVSLKIRDSSFCLLFPIFVCVGFLETYCFSLYVQVTTIHSIYLSLNIQLDHL